MKIKLSDPITRLEESHPSITSRIKYLVDSDGNPLSIRQVCQSKFFDLTKLKSFGTNSAFRLKEILSEYGLFIGMSETELNKWESSNLLRGSDFIEIVSNDRKVLINKREISFIDSYGSKAIVRLIGGSSFITSESFDELKGKILS